MGPDIGVGAQLRVTVNRAETARRNAAGYARIADGGEIVVASGGDTSTMVHELMHVAESRNERLLRASVEAYDEMTAGASLIESSRFAWGAAGSVRPSDTGAFLLAHGGRRVARGYFGLAVGGWRGRANSAGRQEP